MWGSPRWIQNRWEYITSHMYVRWELRFCGSATNYCFRGNHLIQTSQSIVGKATFALFATVSFELQKDVTVLSWV